MLKESSSQVSQQSSSMSGATNFLESLALEHYSLEVINIASGFTGCRHLFS